MTPSPEIDIVNNARRLGERFFAAIEAGRWDDAADMVDAELAVAFRESQLASVIAWAGHRDRIIAMRQSGEGMVGWSAPGHVDHALLARYAGTPLRNIAGIATLADLAALSPLAFVAVCLEARNPTMMLPGGRRIELTRAVVGAAVEGDAIVHILFRLEGPGIQRTDPLSVDVIRLRRSVDGWKVDPTSLMFTLASAQALLAPDDVGDDAFFPDGA